MNGVKTKTEIERRAVELAKSGTRVFPCYGIVRGRCECRAGGECDSPGKHPRITGWQKSATTDAAQVRKWWRKWPRANIGAPTGDGLLVLDVDPAKGGRESLAELGKMPITPTAKTGRGGGHYYFHTDEKIGNRSGILAGLDIRCDGGFVVMPGSIGADRAYAWVRGRTLMQMPLADAPEALIECIQAGRNGHKKKTAIDDFEIDFSSLPLDTGRVLSGVPEGERDDNLFRLAAKLRWADVPKGTAVKIVLDAAAQCTPPFPADKAKKKVASAYERYEAGPSASRMTELANARRLIALHGDDLRYAYSWRQWFVWDGTRWRPDDSGEVESRAKDTVRAIYLEAAAEEDDKMRADLARWATKSASAHNIRAMIELAQSEPGIPLRPADLDADPWLLNAANGTIDLRTGELRPHRREDFITKLAPLVYDPDADAPTWLAFLDRIMDGRQPLVGALQRAFGYALTGEVREQVLFILHGGGGNGKTTLIEAIANPMGDYAQSAAPGLLLATWGDRHPTEIADLRGARFVYTVEVGAGRRLDEELVKKLTGGDTVKARRMRQDFSEYRPTHKLFLAANDRPTIRGTDHAIWRRIRLIPFDVTIKGRERDRRMPERLRAEAPGILAWLVHGCLAWQKGGLRMPDEVKAATKEYRSSQDVVGSFLRDRCKRVDDAWTANPVLYQAYVSWCESNGEKPVSQKVLSGLLERHGYTMKRTRSGRGWKGLRIRAEELIT